MNPGLPFSSSFIPVPPGPNITPDRDSSTLVVEIVQFVPDPLPPGPQSPFPPDLRRSLDVFPCGSVRQQRNLTAHCTGLLRSDKRAKPPPSTLRRLMFPSDGIPTHPALELHRDPL